MYQNKAWRDETGFTLDLTGKPLEPVALIKKGSIYKGGKMSKPKLKLIGEDGNVFFVLGKAIREARKAGWSKERIEKFKKDAMGGDYNVLRLCMDNFDVV